MDTVIGRRTRGRMGILWFNPGSATGKFPALKKSYGILTVSKEIGGEMVDL